MNSSAKKLELFRTTDVKFVLIKGGKKISPEILSIFPEKWINLHGGILPNYRGLDSHLWAMHFKDYGNIGVTLHLATAQLDKGPIIKKFYLPASKKIKKSIVKLKLSSLSREAIVWLISKSHQNVNLKYLYATEEARYFSSFKKHKGLT